MLKGIPGLTNRDIHLVPVIRNTPREPELVEGLDARARRPRFESAFAVLVADHGAYIWGDGRVGGQAPRRGLSLPVRGQRGAGATTTGREHHDPRGAPRGSTRLPDAASSTSTARAHRRVDVAAAVEADKLTEADVFKRTYLGHGTQSSVFVFQGHPGPFRTHVHVTHDEIGYVLEGTGSVTVGGVTRPVKKGDVWVIPANTPHGGQFEDAPAGPVHLVAHRRPGQPGPGLDRLNDRPAAGPPGPEGVDHPLCAHGRRPRPVPAVARSCSRVPVSSAGSANTSRGRARWNGPRPDGHLARCRRRRRRRRVRGADPRWRAGSIIRLGTCGSFLPEIRSGDLLVATAAVREDGVSRAAAPAVLPGRERPRPSPEALDRGRRGPPRRALRRRA